MEQGNKGKVAKNLTKASLIMLTITLSEGYIEEYRFRVYALMTTSERA